MNYWKITVNDTIIVENPQGITHSISASNSRFLIDGNGSYPSQQFDLVHQTPPLKRHSVTTEYKEVPTHGYHNVPARNVQRNVNVDNYLFVDNLGDNPEYVQLGHTIDMSMVFVDDATLTAAGLKSLRQKA